MSIKEQVQELLETVESEQKILAPHVDNSLGCFDSDDAESWELLETLKNELRRFIDAF